MSRRYTQLARIAARNVLRFRLQSGLILFAAAIGVSGVIAASELTLGARAKIDAQFVQLGAELIVVTPKPPITGLRRLQGAPAQITQADYAALGRQLSGVRSSASAALSLRIAAGALSKKTQIVGVEPAFFAMKHWPIREGRLFAADDNRRLRSVALLGSSVAEALFAARDPVGELIMIGRVPFTVIGVLSTRGQGIDAVDEDDQVYVPLQSAMRRLSDTRGYASLTFDAGRIARIAPLSRRIAMILAARHRSDPAVGFSVQDRESTIDAQLATFARLTALSRGVALGVYAMATIGVFAISWLTVGARTAQIGTMRALGARPGDVLLGFFLEGALPSFAGCMVGWAVSTPVSALLASLGQLRVAPASSFASAVGLASSLIFAALSTAAAARAASVSPTAAMRSV
ncbi:MAG TPA: ABC transporter permease [Steroidobacteraceae bacterium]|nr:ABC transporter permease [Steroidobacteraceae bacterium]